MQSESGTPLLPWHLIVSSVTAKSQASPLEEKAGGLGPAALQCLEKIIACSISFVQFVHSTSCSVTELILPFFLLFIYFIAFLDLFVSYSFLFHWFFIFCFFSLCLSCSLYNLFSWTLSLLFYFFFNINTLGINFPLSATFISSLTSFKMQCFICLFLLGHVACERS